MFPTKKFTTAAAAILLSCPFVAKAHAADLTLVEVLTSPARTALLQSMVNEFEQKNPDIQVHIDSLPYDSAFAKLLVMYKSGQAPDVVEMADRWGGIFVKNGQLAPLDKDLAATPALNGLLPRVLTLGKQGTNHVYQIPYGFLLRAVYYSKDMLKAAGVEPPKTMEEFVSDADAVTKKLPGKYGYCMRAGAGGGIGWTLFAMNYGTSGAFFDAKGNSNFSTPASEKGMTKYADLYRDGDAPRESVSWGYPDSVAGFTSGECAILDQDPDAMADVSAKMDASKFGVVPFPTGPSGKAFPLMGYFTWSMSAASQDKPDAWKLMAFLTSKDNDLKWDKAQYMIPAYAGVESDPFYATPQWHAWLSMLSNPAQYKPFVFPAYLPEWGVMSDETMPQEGQAILLGKRDVQSTAAEWAATLTAAQKRYLANK